MLKRIITLILAFTMLSVFVLGDSIYAIRKNEDCVIRNNIIKRVNSCGFELEYIDYKDFENYKNNYSSVFTEYPTDDNSKKFIFYEDGITNEILITEDGNLFLDGDSVLIEKYNEKGRLLDEGILNINEEIEIMPLRAHRSTKMESLPRGITEADLNDHLACDKEVVTLGRQVWRDVGVGVVVSILTSPAIGLWGVLAGGVADAIISVARNKTPYSNHLSYKQCKKRGLYLGKYIMIVKYFNQFYGNRDFTGHLGNQVHYIGYES